MSDTSNAPGLLPCPFCGGEVELIEYLEQAIVECEQCGLKVERWSDAMPHAARDQVVSYWNTRPAITPQQAAKVLLERYRYEWPDEACDAISDNVDGTTAYQLGMALRAIAEQEQDT